MTSLNHDNYIVIFKRADGDEWSLESQWSEMSFERVVADMFNDHYDYDPIDRVICMNAGAGIVMDASAKVAQAVADMSHDKEARPCRNVVQFCDKFGLDCFDEEAAEREDRAYAKQVRGDYRAAAGF
jgi:hypothetical protein